MRPQLVIYALTPFVLTAISAIELQQNTQSLDLYAANPGVGFITSGDSSFESVLIEGGLEGEACGTDTSNKKKLRVRQKSYCSEEDHQRRLNDQGSTESSRSPALNSDEQFPEASPGTITIPDSLPASYTQDHTGHEKLVRYCPDILYTAHLCCDGPLGPFEISPGAIQHKYVDFCQGMGISLMCPKEWDMCCKLYDTLNLITTPGISCIPSVPVGI